MATFSWEKIVSHARAHAPFYQQLYADLPEEPALSELPIIEQEQFWQAHHLDRRTVLTGPLVNGIIFNSGGTTGAPKYSYFGKEEYQTTVALLAKGYEAIGLRDGDRVANLFASGNLYASFTFATDCFRQMRPEVMQFPLGYSQDFAPTANIIEKFNVNVLAGFPTYLLRLIDFMEQEMKVSPRLDRLIYAGELFSNDQQAFLQTRFPGITVCSAGYASVDAGLIGYADLACQAGEHRVFDGATLVEIVDEETGTSITEAGIPGRVVFTNLVRKLMPLIRYPTGDRAEWVEPPAQPDRKFRLLGRSQEAARIASYSVSLPEVTAWLEPLKERTHLQQFQLLVTREERFDRLTFRLVGGAEPPELALAGKMLLETFERCRPDIYKVVRSGIVHEPRVEWINFAELIVSERTGKLLRVVDRRG